jgi:hypothetical protein
MRKITSPLDLNGFYRRRLCSYLIDNTLKAIELTCSNEANLGRLCCFSFCPVLSSEEQGLQIKLRENLIHKAPDLTNTKVSFPEWYKSGRIEVERGVRMIDWDGKKWEVFLKEGVRWHVDDFTDDDFEALFDALNGGEKLVG